MANNTFKITSENTITKISESVKNDILNAIIPNLTSNYSEDNVKIARTTGSSPKNVLAVRVGTLVDEANFEHDYCVTIDVTVKSHKEKKTKNGTIYPFDFEEAVQNYEDYLTEKATKKAEAEAKKAERKASGSKTKAEKAKALAEREAELNEVAEKVKANQKAKIEEQVAKAKANEKK